MFEFIEREYAFTLLIIVLTAVMFYSGEKDIMLMIVGAFIGVLTKSDKKPNKPDSKTVKSTTVEISENPVGKDDAK
jgi:hypothetical protein